MMGSIGIRSMLLSSHQGWKVFVGVLLGCLIDQPLIGKDRAPTSGRFAKELALVVADLNGLDQDYIDSEGIGSDAVFWRVLVLPAAYTLIGPLVLTEHPEDFESAH